MNVPKLRFKEFDGEWEKVMLCKVSDVRDGTHDSPKYVSVGYPLITSKNLNKDGTLNFENVNYINEEDFHKINQRSRVDNNDILFGMIGTIGNPVKVKKPEFAIKNVALIKEKNMSNDYLIHYLKSTNIAKQFYSENKGGTQKFIALNNIRNLKINKPKDIFEVKQIAAFFDALTKKIQLQQQKIDLLQEQKNSFLNRLFPTKASAEPLLRNQKFDGEWSKVKLAGVVDRVKSYSLSRDVENIEDTGMKYVHYGDIHTKVANIIDANSNLPNIELGDYITLEKGDLILADASEDYKGIAEPAILTIQTDYKLVAGLHTIALRPIDIDSFFLYYLFKSSAFKEYGYRIGTGMKVFGITANNVLNFEFMLPSIEEQRFIGNFLKSLDDKIDLQIRKLAVLKNQKQGFMQQMFI
ncbi:MAG TPA: restriction endonuclease subunit S [Kurthia gibsonii]|nr:restriction endonuclease subunit S [Kurthia gibsonii]